MSGIGNLHGHFLTSDTKRGTIVLMKKPKNAVSFRLSAEAIRLILALAEKLELSQSSVVEMAVRLLAERHDVK